MLRPDPASGRSGLPGLLLVHAHPDDEAFATGGLIARAAAQGHRVDLVTCTGGEEGEIHDPTLDYEEAFPRLREIRERRLGTDPGAPHDYRVTGVEITEGEE